MTSSMTTIPEQAVTAAYNAYVICVSEADSGTVPVIDAVRAALTAALPFIRGWPDGHRLIPQQPTQTMLEVMAFNLSAKFGADFTLENQEFALTVYNEAWALGIHSPGTSRQQLIQEKSTLADQSKNEPGAQGELHASPTINGKYEELVTVRYMADYCGYWVQVGKELGSAVVTRSQAEELLAAKDREIANLKAINANLMGDDEDKPRYTTKRLRHEIACATEALEAQLAAARGALDALIKAVDSGKRIERGIGGMTIDATLRRTVINGVPAIALEKAYEARAALEVRP